MSKDYSSKSLSVVLHNAGLKSTTPRTQVLKILMSAKKALRVRDIYTKLANDVDMVTVYRTIETLRKKNILLRLDFGENAAYYELTDARRDRHYAICTECNMRKQVDHCPFPKGEATLRAHTLGFVSITRHSVKYFGICDKCDLRNRKQ